MHKMDIKINKDFLKLTEKQEYELRKILEWEKRSKEKPGVILKDLAE